MVLFCVLLDCAVHMLLKTEREAGQKARVAHHHPNAHSSLTASGYVIASGSQRRGRRRSADPRHRRWGPLGRYRRSRRYWRRGNHDGRRCCCRGSLLRAGDTLPVPCALAKAARFAPARQQRLTRHGSIVLADVRVAGGAKKRHVIVWIFGVAAAAGGHRILRFQVRGKEAAGGLGGKPRKDDKGRLLTRLLSSY